MKSVLANKDIKKGDIVYSKTINCKISDSLVNKGESISFQDFITKENDNSTSTIDDFINYFSIDHIKDDSKIGIIGDDNLNTLTSSASYQADIHDFTIDNLNSRG